MTFRMYFAFDISSLQWTLLQLGLLAVVISFVTFMIRVLPLRRHRKSDDEGDTAGALEDVAVIVYSHDDDLGLATLLPQIFAQDYAGRFEVVVVNEGESAAVTEVVSTMQLTHRNLYLTCTPDGVRNLSRKKLAITLGIKATRMPVIVLTTAGSEIDSPLWLRSMTRHFSSDTATEVVLGFAAAPPYDDSAMGARARSFDFVADSAAWVSPAIRRHPWRGTEHNLAYRRELFFRNKGFSRHLNLRNGDDDIFVSEITNGTNTVVELSPESLVYVPGANSPRAFSDEKARRSFTSRFIPHRPRLLGGVAFTSYFLAPMFALAAGILSPYNTCAWAMSAAVLILWYLTGLIWTVAVKVLHGRRLLLTLPFLAFFRPVRKFKRGLRSIFKHGKRYTWE